MVTITKISKPPHTALYPVPAVLVSCGDETAGTNIITIAWTGTVNSIPPMVYVSIRPDRFSYNIIKEKKEYVINIPSADIAKKVDYCGVTSGRDVSKFAETGLTAVAASEVKAPLIKECPVNIECKVSQIVELGSHHMFLAEVAAVHISEEAADAKGRLDMRLAKAISYCHSQYWAVTEKIGNHGFSRH